MAKKKRSAQYIQSALKLDFKVQGEKHFFHKKTRLQLAVAQPKQRKLPFFFKTDLINIVNFLLLSLPPQFPMLYPCCQPWVSTPAMSSWEKTHTQPLVALIQGRLLLLHDVSDVRLFFTGGALQGAALYYHHIHCIYMQGKPRSYDIVWSATTLS